MKIKSNSKIIFIVLLVYILLQFLWWEFLLVTQNGKIIDEKQKLIELSSPNEIQLKKDIAVLHRKKNMQTIMIVSEGSVFLLLLLFGVYKIKLAQEKESALNNQQKNFFLSITHELKTPIAATKLQLQTLLKQKLNESTQHDLINTALKETERLNSLIDNVLIASRMDANEFDFKLKKQNLSQIINLVINRYYKKEIELREITVCIQDNLFASIDEFSFPSIITNLVDNAVKYSLDPKNIYIDLICENEFITFKISDNGCGISDKDKVNVFTKFFRAENENIRNSKGTGLGLYIVKQIVKGHKGEIVVKNNLPKGITFEIKLNEA